MKYLFIWAMATFISTIAYSQNILKAVVKDSKTNIPLVGAHVAIKSTGQSISTDTAGRFVISGIPNGAQEIQITSLGYTSETRSLTFPLQNQELLEITLTPSEDDEEVAEIVISATRSSRTIANIPTRVEVISGEELEEKGNMKPGDIRMLLAESTGIQTQQTSATSGNSSIRIQGLDGKYTQIIRDGFPLYSGFSGGLGLLQIAPLDLQQVEVIKGSSSTLYGGGAIAGLVNLVSKVPTKERRFDVLLNGTSAAGLDASVYYGKRFTKVGTTIYAAYNHGSPYDPANIDLTAIPKFNRFTVNPKLWLYLNDRTTFSVGLNGTVENRIGGDLNYIKGNGGPAHSYFEDNKTGRFSTQAEFIHQLNDEERYSIKNSVSYFDRKIGLPNYLFSGVQLSTYSELNYMKKGVATDWVAGINVLTDHFSENNTTGFPVRDYSYSTLGGYIQNTVDIGERFTLETGIRGDYHNKYGFFFLPRASALLKINDHFSTRLGGGLGYKAPSVFTEEAERVQFRQVLPINVNNTEAERSYGLNFDVNYRTALFNNTVGFSINHLFFYTRINQPIFLAQTTGGNFSYQQPNGNLNTKGVETNVKLTYGDFKLFVGYTYADVQQHPNALNTPYPLVSKHRLNNVLMYEVEDLWKIGLEAYYFGAQQLNDGSRGRSFLTAGLMAERIWERLSIFLNFENLTDTRQTRFGPIYTGSLTNPDFKDIFAPLDGFVVNGGVKLKF